MTQEDRELLIKDLCARLPYGVIVRHFNHEKDFLVNGVYYNELHGNLYSDLPDDTVIIEPLIYLKQTDGKKLPIPTPTGPDNVLPYLRPMSSMTEKEKADYHFYCETVWDSAEERYYYYDTFKSIDWLNKHHFDFRGLIPMGLALEAPEGMYKTK